ncbi:MAG TPA: ATP-dependent Clp protease adaptor ClpS [Kofleriaceae bacterium]|nr:ATP-dependent Clp protease adaptor ClpS [Kofleriaceae bacterium]
MADAGYIAIVVAGFAAYWWRHMRPVWRRQPLPLTPDAEVAVHVAIHEAEARHQAMASLHILYGLLQDDAVTAAIRSAGADPDALEDRVLSQLGQAPLPAPDPDNPDDGHWLVARAIARRHDRPVGCADLWALLGEFPVAKLLDAAALDRGAVLFILFHGGPAPELPAAADHRDVFVVLRNDHFTTQELVCHVLRDVFALSDTQAQATMLAAHTSGRAVIGRFSAAAARAKIDQARALARPHAFPLWIGTEPA